MPQLMHFPDPQEPADRPRLQAFGRRRTFHVIDTHAKDPGVRHQQDAKPLVVEMRVHASSGARVIDQHGPPVGVERNGPGGNGSSRFRAVTPTAEGTTLLRARGTS